MDDGSPLRPGIMHKFRSTVAQPLLCEILRRELTDVQYDKDTVGELGQKLGSLISERLAREPGMDRYKFITNVSLFQNNNNNSGVAARMGSKCVWDVGADTVVQETFVGPAIRCVAAVFAVYYY
ncbi:Tctex1 domain-containing protein 2 [Coemansia erecta]|nr:Tctex1 domain-containing protein 2 [Coemansia sp. RSA 2618]KAJ2820003.1 Tctex1 domain-containing protein 2 [Coemansia erecta]